MNQVVQHVLEVCKSADPKVEINKKLLLEIAEDHQYPEDVKNIILKTCDQKNNFFCIICVFQAVQLPRMYTKLSKRK